MLVRGEEVKMEVRENFRGGQGKIYAGYYVNEERSSPGAMRIVRIVIPPGSSIGYHQHLGDEEVYLILRGKGEVNDNGQVKTASPGDLVLTRSGEYHGIKNVGSEDLELLAIVSKV